MIYYVISIGVILLCAALGGWASAKVHGAYNKYGAIPARSRMTGRDTAERLLMANGICDISIGWVRGTLSDHYHPKKQVVNLSDSTYGRTSIAAVAVAAHEIGHAVQKKRGYFFYKLRTALAPVTSFGSMLAVPLVLIGLILELSIGASKNSDIGWYLAWTGVALYGLATLFALVTLPVELDASRRAKKMLIKEGILAKDELPYAEKMLSAAAMTYVASLVTSLLLFLRFALWVFVMFGGRRRND